MAGDPIQFPRRGQIADLAARHRLPGIYPIREFVDAGGLMSPADLPVEQPTKIE